ncbi:MAG: phytoene desaturase [Candidatus Omnitrophica bacterium]|nr:phytoene desaturase [Candidatus Omnitrophota bacterium]
MGIIAGGKDQIAVVGAGVGGLAVAARLGKKGFNVSVFEKLSRPGGRCHLLEDSGFKFDMGPSFVLMPPFFKEFFDSCGEKIEDHLTLRELDVHYKIYYADGTSLSIHNDCRKTKDELENIEPGSALGFDKFIEHTEGVYRAVEPLLYKSFTFPSLLDHKLWPVVFKIDPFRSYWSVAKKYFKTEKLCYAFTFEAMFMGVSPYQAPSFYSIITYADHIQKVLHPMGGMYQIPLALERIAGKNGAKIFYNSPVEGIRKNKGRLALTVKGEDLDFDNIVVNADYPFSQTDLLRRKIKKYKYSCSVYLLYLGLKTKIPSLEHHNLFFSGDLDKNLNQIFKENTVPEDPSFYVHVPTKTDPSLAPEGKDIVYILVPVANFQEGEYDMACHEAKIRKIVFDKINEATGVNLEELIEVERKFTPEDFISRYNLKYGATFGLAHNLMQSALFRPANKDPQLNGVYYSGASTQPGGGLPVVLASSRIVADMIARQA